MTMLAPTAIRMRCRRPRARYTASANRPRTRNTSRKLTARMTLTLLRAVSSWFPFMTTSWPASGGSLSRTRPPRPVSATSCSSSGRRSSTTLPSVDSKIPFFPSTTAIRSSCARRFAFSHSAWTFGRARSWSVVRTRAGSSASAGGGPTGVAARGGRPEPPPRGGPPLFERLPHVDVRVQLVDQVHGDRASDLGILEELRAGARPVVRVQRLALHPHVQRRDEPDQRRDHDQQPRRPAVPPVLGCARRLPRLRRGGRYRLSRARQVDLPAAPNTVVATLRAGPSDASSPRGDPARALPRTRGS